MDNKTKPASLYWSTSVLSMFIKYGKIWNVDKKLASVNNIKQNGVGLV